jgi:hypothetical protein
MVAALGATNGQRPHNITQWTVIDESDTIDVATIDVPRGFDERDQGKTSLAFVPPVRAEKGEPCIFFGFPGLHRLLVDADGKELPADAAASAGAPAVGVRLGLSPISDFVVSVSERHFVIADEEGEREVYEYRPGLKAFGPTGGVSGASVFVRRDDALVIAGVMYEGGEGTDATFYVAHADFLRDDGTLDHSRIPPR